MLRPYIMNISNFHRYLRRRGSIHRALFVWFALCISACDSPMYSRMLRVTPFDGEAPSAERVNVWPLYAYDHGEHAVLWPFVAWDKEGFAFRPVYAHRDGKDSLLWPLTQWEQAKKEGWFLNFIYLDEFKAVFPLACKGERWRNIAPAWWFRSSERVTDWGLFPLYAWDGRGKDSVHYGPLWLSRWDRGGGTSYFLPLWYQDRDQKGDVDEEMLFPLYFRKHRLLITPLGGLGWDHQGKLEMANVLGVLYHRQWGGEDSTVSVMWPFHATWKEGSASGSYIFPLYSHESKPRRSTMSALAGLCHTVTDDDTGRGVCLWPLYSYHHEASAPAWGYPLTLMGGSTYGDESSFHVGMNLLYRVDEFTTKETHKRDSRVLLFFTSETVDAPADPLPTPGSGYMKMLGTFENLLRKREYGFLFGAWKAAVEYHKVYKKGVDSEQLLALRRLKKEYGDYRQGFENFNIDNGEGLSVWAEKWTGSADTSDLNLALALIKSFGGHTEVTTEAALRETLIQAVASHTEVVRTSHYRFPIVWEHLSEGPVDREWSFLNFWLFSVMEAKRVDDRSEFSVLHSLFSMDKDKDSLSWDAFPFLSYTSRSSVKQEGAGSEFSFLWRLFHLRNDESGSSGHILFIPFGG